MCLIGLLVRLTLFIDCLLCSLCSLLFLVASVLVYLVVLSRLCILLRELATSLLKMHYVQQVQVTDIYSEI